jgi:hypothetical protein
MPRGEPTDKTIKPSCLGRSFPHLPRISMNRNSAHNEFKTAARKKVSQKTVYQLIFGRQYESNDIQAGG